ncbi:MAG: HAD-IIB family hydrolase [Candidatus Hydrothermia bacterium]|nr:HAD-IIB family hydrolase [Candidatus Hydrothermia bacterium]
MKKLLVLDLDGTLIDKQDRISSEKLSALNEIRNHFDITIATGRSYLSALYFAKLLNLNLPFICFDGALISDKDGNDYFKCFMEKYEIFEILNSIEKNIALNVFYKNYTLVNSNMLSLGIVLKHWRLNYKIFYNQIYDFDIYKIVLASYNYDTLKKIENLLRNFRNSGYYLYPSGKKKGLYVIDISNRFVNKGRAILEFKKLFNYDFIISVGDYINDLELFRYSDIKIAPLKSHKIIQKMADYLIKDFNDLLEILRKFSFS